MSKRILHNMMNTKYGKYPNEIPTSNLESEFEKAKHNFEKVLKQIHENQNLMVMYADLDSIIIMDNKKEEIIQISYKIIKPIRE
jgi:hypothetical protein